MSSKPTTRLKSINDGEIKIAGWTLDHSVDAFLKLNMVGISITRSFSRMVTRFGENEDSRCFDLVQVHGSQQALLAANRITKWGDKQILEKNIFQQFN